MAIHLVHPHIVRTLEYGTSTKGEHFLVMEFIDGVSLQFIREARSARTAQKVELLAQAAEGLAAVHAAGFIHHDINPRNFLVDREQQVKLIDFGLTVPNTPAFCVPAIAPARCNTWLPSCFGASRSTSGSTSSPSASWRSSS